MQKKGFTTIGIDSSESAVDIATKKGLNVIHGEIEVLDNGIFKDNKIDVITLWHSLEHFYSPRSILQKLNNILKDNGLLIIALPNFDSIQSHLFKEDWFGLRLPYHLYHFTPEILSRLVHETGFEVIKCFPALPIHSFGCLNISSVAKIKQYKDRSFLKYLFYRSLITLSPLFIFVENQLGKMASMCLVAKKSQ